MSLLPYDATAAALLQLLATTEGQRAIHRLLGDAGVTQAMLDQAVRSAQPPKDPTLPRPKEGA